MKFATRGSGFAPECAREDAVQLIRRDARIADQLLHVGVCGDRREIADLVGPRRERRVAVGLRHAKQRLGVRTGDGGQFGHDVYSCAFSSFSNAACLLASISTFKICSAPLTANAAT